MNACPPARRLPIDRSAALRLALAIGVFGVALPAAAQSVASLSFAEFYKRPIGPRGLEPSAALLALAGARVQISGFVAHGAHHEPQPQLQPQPQTVFAILAPVPVALDDEDEGLADDLPASVAYLHWSEPRIAAAIAACRGAVRVTGRLELGRHAEPDGRTSFVRLETDDVQCLR